MGIQFSREELEKMKAAGIIDAAKYEALLKQVDQSINADTIDHSIANPGTARDIKQTIITNNNYGEAPATPQTPEALKQRYLTWMHQVASRIELTLIDTKN